MPTWYDASGQPPFPTGYNSVSSGPTPNPNADSRGGQFWYGQDPLRTQAPPQPDPPTPAPPPPPNPRANYTFNPNGWYGGFRFNGPNRFGQHAGQVTSGVQQGALGLPGYDEDRDTMTRHGAPSLLSTVADSPRLNATGWITRASKPWNVPTGASRKQTHLFAIPTCWVGLTLLRVGTCWTRARRDARPNTTACALAPTRRNREPTQRTQRLRTRAPVLSPLRHRSLRQMFYGVGRQAG